MRICTLLAALLVLTCSIASPAAADTRVELIGRVADNGFAYYVSATPWSGARVGEYFYTSFNVTGTGIDITQPLDHQQQPLVEANVFNIVDTTFTARLADIPLNVPVAQVTDPVLGPISAPAVLLAHYYISVDTFYLDGAGIPFVFGSCCYPDGSCVFVSPAQCTTAIWTASAVCDPNPCAQPTGACCDSGNGCAITLQANCAGDWTTGTTCVAGTTCPQTPGSCCAANGSCQIATSDSCTASSGAWTFAGTCTATTCPIGIIPGYAMSMYMSHQIPPVAWNAADFSQITGSYAGSLFNNSRSWLISFVGVDHNSYEMFIDVQKMVVSTDTTATGSCCPGDGHCLVTTQAICPTTSWTSGGACTTGLCPSSGGCCFPDGTCDLRTAASCASVANSVYQGSNSSCVPSPCATTGGCCNAGSCTVVLQTACLATAGSWLGAGTTCDIVAQHATSYSFQAGACCTNGTCSLVSRQTECNSSSVYTQGATCSVTPCPNAGACCDPSGACTIARANLCNTNPQPPTLPSTYFGDGTSCSPIPCAGIGPCCNVTTGLCIMDVQTSCAFTWSATGTCVSICQAGECCNLTSHQCRLYTLSACNAWDSAGNVTWNLNTTCDTVCVFPYLPLNDAVFVVGPGTTTPSTYTDTIAVTDPGTVSEVEVWVNLVIGRANDLKLKITGPNGVTRDLMTRVGSTSPCTTTPIGGGPGVGNVFLLGQYVFLDAATTDIYTAITTGVGGSGGRFKPSGCGGPTVNPVVLNTAYAGIPIAGSWTLTIIDERSGVAADLHSWGLSFNGGYPAPCTIGHCVLPQGGCLTSTYAQCVGTWSIGACTTTTCSTGTPGACCYLNSCTVLCSSLCPSTGQFAGSGTVCAAATCNVACCQGSGACSISTAASCGGTPGAIGSTCSPNTCPQPRACCATAGACTLVLASACTAQGNTPGAAGSSCSPNTCPGQAPPPANDVCSVVASGGAGAADIVLTNGYAAMLGTLVGATADGVQPSCGGGGAPAPDLWYRFTPPGTGGYTLTTCLGQPDTLDSLISVWTSCSTQLPGACDDNGCGFSNQAKLTTTLVGGTPYLVRVAMSAATTPNPTTFKLEVEALGACCLQGGSASDPVRCFTGTCIITYPDNCSGVHQGFATTCSPSNPCPQNLGQCCKPDFTCTTSCNDLCQSVGGTFGLIGTTCSASNNPCPIAICCRGSTCTIINYFLCEGNANAGAIVSSATGQCGASTSTPCCYADYDKIDGVTVGDIFNFLNDWFAGSPFAIVGGNGDTGTLSVQNIFDFLNAWFAGCS